MLSVVPLPPMQAGAPATSSSAPSPCNAMAQLCADLPHSLSGEIILDGFAAVHWESTREPSGVTYRIELQSLAIDAPGDGTCSSGSAYRQDVPAHDGDRVTVRVLDSDGRTRCHARTVIEP